MTAGHTVQTRIGKERGLWLLPAGPAMPCIRDTKLSQDHHWVAPRLSALLHGHFQFKAETRGPRRLEGHCGVKEVPKTGTLVSLPLWVPPFPTPTPLMPNNP